MFSKNRQIYRILIMIDFIRRGSILFKASASDVTLGAFESTDNGSEGRRHSVSNPSNDVARENLPPLAE